MERRSITVSGVVQGVGFRPFVYRLAVRLGLSGFVTNQSGGVCIEVEGDPRRLDQFFAELTTRPPPLVHIARVQSQPCPLRGEPGFRIESSGTQSSSPVFISPDVATCDDCLAELFDPADRRHLYPFLNCTNCGPRLTIIRGAPYDRARTTMASFALCAACRAEYDDPGDRRFHAQPVACRACGPRLRLLGPGGETLLEAEPLAGAADMLRCGKIGAIKGLGGYHLACAAGDAAAVAELRRRKHRDEKPFAVMVADEAAAREICEVSAAEEALLLSPRRPIVLLRRRQGARLAAEVAPGNPCLGVMLPYTPLHHLLLNQLSGTPLVLTSGNRSDEPIAFIDDDALERLRGIADFFLTHDRPIHLRCDDSVTRVVSGEELPVRRSRGYAPGPLPLPLSCRRPVLALGAQLKSAFALGRGGHAFLSHHLGDLDHYEAYRAYTEAVTHYERLFDIRPEVLVHDLHPDYASTRYALERARGGGVELLAVQHHHAHMASCMAENGLDEPVVGVTFDGAGLGPDGTVWGGEFLVGDYRQFRRAAHLRLVAMPGGEQATREPWRMAAVYLADAGVGWDLLEKQPPAALRAVRQMIERRFPMPLTSSAGRLFDAVAALAGVRRTVSYEGQAAVELEGLACDVTPDGVYPFALTEGEDLEADTRPLIAAVADDARAGVSAAVIGRRFHSTLVDLIAAVCRRLEQSTGLRAVVLSGGVFLNGLLLGETVARLAEEGFRVYRHRRVPPNDGGLSLGQTAIAAARA